MMRDIFHFTQYTRTVVLSLSKSFVPFLRGVLVVLVDETKFYYVSELLTYLSI